MKAYLASASYLRETRGRSAYRDHNHRQTQSRHSLQRRRPRLERIRAQPGARLRAMERKQLVAATRQYPAGMLGQHAGGHARLMRQIVADQRQSVAVVGQRVLRHGAVLLANEQRTRFGRVIDGRAAGRHVLADRWPVLAAVALQPNANRSGLGFKTTISHVA